MLWAYLALGAFWLGGAFAISLGAVIGHHVSIDSSGGLTSLDYPGGSDAWWGKVQAVFFPAVGVCWLAGQVLSFRRSAVPPWAARVSPRAASSSRTHGIGCRRPPTRSGR